MLMSVWKFVVLVTSYPPSLMVTVTSMGWLTTPTTDLTSEMNRRGNQMMQIKKKMISPPIPYLTIFFFFCPLGCGYFCQESKLIRIKTVYRIQKLKSSFLFSITTVNNH